jgi:hypothetical protein
VLLGFVQQLTMVNEGSGAIFGISEKIGCGLAMANKWTDPPVQIIMSFFIGVPALLAAMVTVAVYFSIYAVPLVWVALYAYYQLVFLATPPADCEKYITFKARLALARCGHKLGQGEAPLRARRLTPALALTRTTR